jgi:rhodanese-related sulfurtransferase
MGIDDAGAVAGKPHGLTVIENYADRPFRRKIAFHHRSTRSAVMNSFARIFAFAVVLSVTACQYTSPEYLHMLSPAQLNAVMQQQDIVLIDVHTPEQQHIKGTDLVIPYDQISRHLGQLPQDKTTPIYLYCRSGHMANVAARELFDAGYRNLYNLDGGTNAWRQAGLPLQ